jgi:hypothetical protein
MVVIVVGDAPAQLTRMFPLVLLRVSSLDQACGQGCVLHDPDAVFGVDMRVDLSPLKLDRGNWKAINSIDDHTYYINVCGALNPNLPGAAVTATRYTQPRVPSHGSEY